MPDPHNPLNRSVGEWESRPYRDDFHTDSVDGFISGPAVETEFVTPSFSAGEVYDIRVQISFSAEPSGVAVLRLMDEDEANVIVRRVIDGFEGSHFELRAIVTAEEVGSTGARSPDLQIEFVEDDTSNYFVTCRAIRLRRPSETGVINGREAGESFSSTR